MKPYLGLFLMAAFCFAAVPARAACPLADPADCTYVDDDTCGLCDDGVTTCTSALDCGGATCTGAAIGSGTEADPYCRIQDAYNAVFPVTSPAAPSTILVLPGTYQECVELWGFEPPSSQDKPVHLVADAYLTGEDNTVTIIDGNGICDGIATAAEPAVSLGGTGASIEGFTVMGGGRSGVFAQGSVVITHNLITGNQSELGGGIYLLTASCYYGADVSALIEGNEVSDNFVTPPDPSEFPVDCNQCTSFAPCGSGDGGGILVFAEGVLGCLQDDEVTIRGNTIRDNLSENFNVDPCTGLLYTTNGSGLFALTNGEAGTVSSVVITQNTIAGNFDSAGTDGYGGGIYATTFGLGAETIEITDNTVGGPTLEDGNIASLDGGGISARIRPPSNNGNHTIVVDDNLVQNNLAENDGGGLELLAEARGFGAGDRYSMTASNNVLIENESGFDGGAIKAIADIQRSTTDAGATLDPVDEMTFSIRGNTLQDNFAGLGGGGAILRPVADGDDFDGLCGNFPLPALARIDFTNNIVAGNFAENFDPGISDNIVGGGVLVFAQTFGEDAVASVSFDRSTLVGNALGVGAIVGGIEILSVPESDCLTGTIFGETQIGVDRTIIYDNDGIGIGGPFPDANDTLTVDVTNSDVFGHSPDYEPSLFPTPPAGNISVDPLLDPVTFAPDVCSPVFDINGESAGFWASPDADGDGIMDGIDILDLAVAFGTSDDPAEPRYDPNVDLNRDGSIEGDDLAYMAAEFGEVCLP